MTIRRSVITLERAATNSPVFLAKTGRARYQVRAFSSSCRRIARSAAIAQLVEHVIRNDGVTGSSPVCGTSFFAVRPGDIGSRSRNRNRHVRLISVKETSMVRRSAVLALGLLVVLSPALSRAQTTPLAGS